MSCEKTEKSIFFSSLAITATTLVALYSNAIFMIMFFVCCVINANSVCKNGFLKTVIINFCTTVFCAVGCIISPHMSLHDMLILPLIIIPGITMGFSFTKKCAFKDILVYQIAFYFLFFIAILAGLRFFYDFDMTKELREITVTGFGEQIGILKNFSSDFNINYEDVESQIFNMLYVVLPGTIPFGVFLISIAAFLIQYAFCRGFCAKYFIKTSTFLDGFDTFKVGIPTNVVFVLSLITAFLDSSMFIVMISINIAMIILVLYLVETLSLIEHKLKVLGQNAIKRKIIIFIIMITSLVFSTLLPIINVFYIFIILGITDSIFDFRKLNAKKVIK